MAKNFVIPFSRGTLNELKRGLQDGYISAPALHFLTEDAKKCLAFVDTDGTIYEMNLSRLDSIEEKLEGLNDPDTGEAVNVTQYVQTQSTEIAAQAVEEATTVTIY